MVVVGQKREEECSLRNGTCEQTDRRNCDPPAEREKGVIAISAPFQDPGIGRVLEVYRQDHATYSSPLWGRVILGVHLQQRVEVPTQTCLW